MSSAVILRGCLALWSRMLVRVDEVAFHSRSPKFDLGPPVREVCVVESGTSCSTSSTGFDEFRRECVVKLSSKRTS